MNLKLVGSSLIVAGTALGAGMLAIPMVLAQFGLLWGTLLMLFIWAGTTYAALLLLEASCKVGGGVSMNAIARETLGKGGQLVTNGLLYALLVCLLMAYIIGAGDLVQKITASVGLSVSTVSSQVGFTILVGLIVSAGTGVVDKLNRGLFIGMIVALVLTLFALAPSVSFEGLNEVVSSDKMALIKTSSVLFTSFGFMVVIPSLVTYNKEASKTQLRNMIVVGSTIPLVCYLLWLFAVVGNLPPHELVQYSNVTELISVLWSTVQWLGVYSVHVYWFGIANFILGCGNGALRPKRGLAQNQQASSIRHHIYSAATWCCICSGTFLSNFKLRRHYSCVLGGFCSIVDDNESAPCTCRRQQRLRSWWRCDGHEYDLPVWLFPTICASCVIQAH